MLLKGFLYDNLDLEPDEILYKFQHTYRHNLRRLWREFKRVAPDPDMDDFDNLIAELHKSETIRYPDTVARRGANPSPALLVATE